LFEKLERFFTHWIDSHNEWSAALSFMIIQHKALSLFEDLKKKVIKKGDEGAKQLEFKGSHRWFERFKKHTYLHSLRLNGEAASADSEAASIFPEEHQMSVIEGGYLPKQIFNVDETSLFWKRMPSCTFISHDENKVPGQGIEGSSYSITWRKL
jgi:hypothetical protein